MIKFFDLTKQYKEIGRELEDVTKSVLTSGKYVLGEQVKQFEKDFAKYIGVDYCVGIASGTDALMLSLKVITGNYKGKVLTVPNTYVATVEAIIHAGYIPRFVDIDPDTGLMDLDKVEEAITDDTIAIIPVHLFGQCVDIERLGEISNKYGISIIEDACQAHGATFNGKKSGSMGHLGCFSFYPSKNLGGAGDGGAITTNHEILYKNILALRDHGQIEKSVHGFVGHNSRLDELQAAILNIKLKYLDKWNDNRRKVSWIYDRIFMENQSITPLISDSRGIPVYHLYVIKVKNRENIIERLKNADIEFGIHYPIPIHLQPAYDFLGYKKGDFPMAENFCNEIISLPMYPEMSLSEVNLISRALINV